MPCLHALRERFPKARIGWLVEELSATLLRGHPEIDDLIVVPKKRWRREPLRSWLSGEKVYFYRKLRAGKWDVAIDFQGLTKSGWPAWLSGAPIRIGFGDADGRELNKVFTNVKVRPGAEAPHIIQRNMALLRPLGVDGAPIDWQFPDFTIEREKLRPFINSTNGRGYVVLYPGAGWPTKRWPPEHFAALARLAAEWERAPELVLAWGPGEEKLCDEIMRRTALPDGQLRMAPPTNLRELAVLISAARAVVGGDTGPIHLAAAFNVPVVAIYGASDPIRNGPWGSIHAIMQSDSSTCTACWKTRCDHIECLKSIAPERVFQSLVSLCEK